MPDIEKHGAVGDWRPLTILESASGSVEFTDTAATPENDDAFYRARMLD